MTENSYYSKNLSALNLKRCYDIASPRIKEYLQEEITFVLSKLKPSDLILELGCGYGRVMAELANAVETIYGIDISLENIKYAHQYLADFSNIELFQMDAKAMIFPRNTFDVVIAIQNSISAFKIPPEKLVLESLRVLKPKGLLILSSYSEKFWNYRLEWFKAQANEGLLGEIDFGKTKDGTIVCKDGFIATTFTINDFHQLVSVLELKGTILEVNNSSVFCMIVKE